MSNIVHRADGTLIVVCTELHISLDAFCYKKMLRKVFFKKMSKSEKISNVI